MKPIRSAQVDVRVADSDKPAISTHAIIGG